MRFVLFTDNLADLSIPACFDAAGKIGFDGLDLTVRPGGHVKPENADRGLAEARKAADAAGMSIDMISTAVSDVTSPHAESIFAAASHYGIRTIKLGYWKYEPFGTAARQIEQTRARLAGIVRLARKYQVLPCIHIHSGRSPVASGPLLYMLLEEFKPGEVGAYVDPMHMTVEGGNGGWEIGLDLLAPWVSLVGVKNFRWDATERDRFGQQRFRTTYTPLADGQAPLPEFVTRLRELGYDGTYSLHSEYKGGSSFRQLATPELLEQTEADLKFFKSLFT
jgi:sugar phosphate isomerase/epimerase